MKLQKVKPFLFITALVGTAVFFLSKKELTPEEKAMKQYLSMTPAERAANPNSRPGANK